MSYTRALKHQLPFFRGEDVLELQRQLHKLSFVKAGLIDGIFGLKTEEAVIKFQHSRQLKEDGIVGALTWTELFKESHDTSKDKMRFSIDSLKENHNMFGGVSWALVDAGISIEKDTPVDTGGEPKTVARIWLHYGDSITKWSEKFGVPAELIVATICTETRGDPTAIREEPGYLSDNATPNKVSPGITQTLISTARGVLGDKTLDRAWLLVADNSIRAGTAYIASQWKKTEFDPPKVACAYNAGGVYRNDGDDNRWKMRQYPINSSEHADRFIRWFNDCVRYFDSLDSLDSLEKVPAISFVRFKKAYALVNT